MLLILFQNIHFGMLCSDSSMLFYVFFWLDCISIRMQGILCICVSIVKTKGLPLYFTALSNLFVLTTDAR